MKFQQLSYKGIAINVFRDDLKHDIISGNKLHKLAPNLELARNKNCSAVLSFGGAYSNHLHALAWACKEAGFKSIGVVRGELHSNLTPTLQDCQRWGMQLIPSQRKDYRAYQQALTDHNTCYFSGQLTFPIFSDLPKDTLVIPEGGSNLMAIKSVSDAYRGVFKAIASEGISHAICATGTGATLAGLYLAAPKQVKVIGVQAVAEGQATLDRIQNWLNEKPVNLSLVQGHWGGFGKIPLKLLDFIEEFETTYKIPLDPVYNGKAMFKIVEMINAGHFKSGDKILFVHTGGLQGKKRKADE